MAIQIIRYMCEKCQKEYVTEVEAVQCCESLVILNEASILKIVLIPDFTIFGSFTFNVIRTNENICVPVMSLSLLGSNKLSNSSCLDIDQLISDFNITRDEAIRILYYIKEKPWTKEEVDSFVGNENISAVQDKETVDVKALISVKAEEGIKIG